jgi:glycerophosphoryl diester phosphodiesterase
MAPSPARTPFRLLGSSRPAVIAHGGGNSVHQAREAVAAGADLLEVDLWVHNGRFEARHERAVYPLPILFEKWYLRRAPRRARGLEHLIAEYPDAPLFLDIKNGGRIPAGLLKDLLAADPGRRLFASSPYWPVLRAVAEEAPSVGLFYSVDSRAQLDLVLSVAERDALPLGVSCRHTHLTRERVERLHRLGLAAIAWTVDDVDRAAELASWGVAGITTHRVEEVRSRLEGPP